MAVTAAMTNSHSRSGFRRGSLTALPLLLVPLLMTACASPGGSPSPSSTENAGSTTSAAFAGTSAAGTGDDLYRKYTTSAQFCALVPLKDVSAAMQVKPAYPAPKLSSSPVECTYADGSASSIVSVEWRPKGGGMLDDYLEISPKDKPVAVDVAGHAAAR